MAYREYWNDLVDSIPRLPPPLAQTIVNRAWRDIVRWRLWSWLVGTGYITTPVAINTGTIDVTLGSTSVVVSASAAAALDAVALANPPLASAQVGIGRQIRIASQVTGTPGPLYNIAAWTSPSGPLTLDRVYAEATASNQPYTCYKAYYQPPPSNGSASPDFLRYFSVTNMAMGYTIRGRKLFYTQAKLDGIDPQRGATGDAYDISAYLDNPNPAVAGPIVHEWYPHPVNQRVYRCMFLRYGANLSDTVDIPTTLDPDLLMERAYMYACKWALKMVGVYPELGAVNWVMAYNMHAKDWKDYLLQCIKKDDEIAPLVAFQQGGVFDFPLGGQFVQGHDVSSLVGGLD